MGGCEFKLKTEKEQELTLKNFELISIVGQGGFGKVYKAKMPKTNQLVALKIMAKQKVIQKRSVSSVMNELQLLQTLQHDFIVNIITAFQDRLQLYLAMDYMGGGDLRYHLCRCRRMNEQITKHIAECIIVGLEYIHQNGVLHRDIKPENLVFDDRGFLRITDFGIARIWKPENSSETSGTPGYMAPEVMCRQNHGIGVDYYALGIILYECCLGKRPYNGRSRQEIRDQIIAKQAKITDVPIGWSEQSIDFINALLIRKPAHRLGVNGPEEVKAHPWFKGTDWNAIENKTIQSPFIPDPNLENYVKDTRRTEEDFRGIVLNDDAQSQFDGYDHYKSQEILLSLSPQSQRGTCYPIVSTHAI